jgi:NADPH-dependent glutamate synthase beta subunit-like oxidoreductase
MTVANDLTLLGYKVTVFEASAKPGGMLTAGVPVFRLPRELVMAEIDAILSLGVELKCNQRLGRDFTIQQLRDQGYKAVFLGVGLPKGRKLDLPGSNLDGVYDGMDFLRAFNDGTPLPVGNKIVVIGGGNVAYDVARSAVRPLDAMETEEHTADTARGESVAYDVARSAMRLSGKRDVVRSWAKTGMLPACARSSAPPFSTPTIASARHSTNPMSIPSKPIPSFSPLASPLIYRSCSLATG